MATAGNNSKTPRKPGAGAGAAPLGATKKGLAVR